MVIYTHENKNLRERLDAEIGPESKIKTDSRIIERLEKGPMKAEVIIHFSDGGSKVEGFLAHKPTCQLKGPFAQQLRLDLTPTGDIKTSPPCYQTSVPGVFAAGDTSYPIKIVPNALFTGAAAAAGVSAQLQAERLGHNSLV